MLRIEITVRHYFHQDNSPGIGHVEFLDLLARVTQLEKNMSAAQDTLTQIKADVAAQVTVKQSVITLMQGLAGRIDTLLSSAVDGTISIADLQTLKQDIETNTADLGAAVVAGTAELNKPGPVLVVSNPVITPAGPISLGVNGTQQFSADQNVNWAASAGSLGPSGLFTAPGATGTPGAITITATSVADATKVSTVVVNFTTDPNPPNPPVAGV